MSLRVLFVALAAAAAVSAAPLRSLPIVDCMDTTVDMSVLPDTVNAAGLGASAVCGVAGPPVPPSSPLLLPFSGFHPDFSGIHTFLRGLRVTMGVQRRHAAVTAGHNSRQNRSHR